MLVIDYWLTSQFKAKNRAYKGSRYSQKSVFSAAYYFFRQINGRYNMYLSAFQVPFLAD